MARLTLNAARDAVTQFLDALPADVVLEVVQDDESSIMRIATAVADADDVEDDE